MKQPAITHSANAGAIAEAYEGACYAYEARLSDLHIRDLLVSAGVYPIIALKQASVALLVRSLIERDWLDFLQSSFVGIMPGNLPIEQWPAAVWMKLCDPDILPPFQYHSDYSAYVNRLDREFYAEFCNDNGQINWSKLVSFNSGNLQSE